MAFLSDIAQKIKGIIQQGQGEAQKPESGIKGGFTQTKGKVNETIADWKLADDYGDNDI